jgi:transcriptional regulator of heat shock response
VPSRADYRVYGKALLQVPDLGNNQKRRMTTMSPNNSNSHNNSHLQEVVLLNKETLLGVS